MALCCHLAVYASDGPLSTVAFTWLFTRVCGTGILRSSWLQSPLATPRSRVDRAFGDLTSASPTPTGAFAGDDDGLKPYL
jgi:hypothetical protein